MGAVDPSVYKSVLKVRRAYGFDIACFLMRFYQYMMNVGTVTMITLSGHSFLLAGAVSSAIAISTFIVAPQVSRPRVAVLSRRGADGLCAQCAGAGPRPLDPPHPFG